MHKIAPSGADVALVSLLTAPLLVFGLVGWDHLTEFARSVATVVPGMY